jgi:hypothetical protein
MRVFDISTMNRLRTDSVKLIIDDGRWMSVRAGGKHPFGGLHCKIWGVEMIPTPSSQDGGAAMQKRRKNGKNTRNENAVNSRK